MTLTAAFSPATRISVDGTDEVRDAGGSGTLQIGRFAASDLGSA
jgi:hypothetical protein